MPKAASDRDLAASATFRASLAATAAYTYRDYEPEEDEPGWWPDVPSPAWSRVLRAASYLMGNNPTDSNPSRQNLRKARENVITWPCSPPLRSG